MDWYPHTQILTEIKAMQQKQMKMNNWQKALDTFLTVSDMEIL